MDHRTDQGPNPDYLGQISGALDWWSDAGVDCDFLDEPVTWLAPPEEPAERRPRPPVRKQAETGEPERPRIAADTLPADLAAFTQWWMTEPLLAEGNLGDRVPPRGAAGAKLMVLVEEPEAHDGEMLLSGPQGKLLSAMLAAFGIAPNEAYVASALPRHMPAPDWADVASRGLGDVLAHHVRLVAPERVLALGGNVSPLLGHEPPQRPAVLRVFKDDEREIPILACWGLPAFLGQPRAKAALWRAWLEATKP